MTELWVLCPHGMTRKHWWPAPLDLDENCPGGHPATVEEVVEWLVERGEWPHGIAPTAIKVEE